MATVAVEDFMAEVLGDEGWQEDLDEPTIEAAIARLEAMLPEGTALDEARADRLRAALRALAGVKNAATPAERLARVGLAS